MLLYHGTSESRAARAIEAGALQPRAQCGLSNWVHSIPSHADCVYLTSCYAGYFASVAASELSERWAVFEIDATKLQLPLFRPDEDALEQLSRNQPLRGKATMEARTQHFRDNLDDYAHHWADSLQRLGNCAYKGEIPTSAIRQVAFFEPKQNRVVASAWMDPTISVMNHMLCARKYEALTRWLFGAAIAPHDFYGLPEEFVQHLEAEQLQVVKAGLDERSAVELRAVSRLTGRVSSARVR